LRIATAAVAVIVAEAVLSAVGAIAAAAVLSAVEVIVAVAVLSAVAGHRLAAAGPRLAAGMVVHLDRR
jgi:hypothetical protein